MGQLTGIVAFVNIRFIALFYGRVGRAIWFGADTRIVWRVLLFLMVIALCPLILLGLPFVLWEKFRGKPPEPPAVRDGQARSQRSAE